MNIRKRRDERKQIVVVVLEGTKVSTQNSGLAPLCLAMREINPDDEIIVFALLRTKAAASDPSSTGDVGRLCSLPCEPDSYIRLLHEEISQRKDLYLRIFRPFYYSCKTNGVKFQLKIAAGCRPKDIIIEEANNVKATWIILDRCFARHLTLRLSGTNCNLSLVSDDEETMSKHCLHAKEKPESSTARGMARSSKSPKLRKGPISAGLALNRSLGPPLITPTPTISQEIKDQTACTHCIGSEPPGQAIHLDSSHAEQKKLRDQISTNVQTLLQQPLQLTWELIQEITEGFKSQTCNGQNKRYMSYFGYFEDHKSFVLVKKYKKDSGSSILEAERKAALFLQHKNIHTLIGYHKSEHGIILVYPLQRERSLDEHACDLNRKQWELKFQDKLKIAIGIAQGIRYMHEECIRGPIAHGRLQPCNIFLASDWQPMISGFEHATWLQFRQDLQASSNRFQLENSLHHGAVELIKSDILAFGVLLLRLFCKKSVPQDDKSMIEWARPLLLDRAFHLLLEDENSEDLDMHDMFRVMAAATMCTVSRPISRPSISEVISILKGENFCIIQPSPSISENSV